MNWRQVKEHREKRRKEFRAYTRKNNQQPNTNHKNICANSQDGLAPKKTH
jgi:hypothetical protein